MANHEEEPTIKMVLNEPAKGIQKSQIEEYVEFNGTPGVQHVALHTNDILTSVQRLQERGVEFLTIPPEYYDDLRKRLASVSDSFTVAEDLDRIQALNILIDFDDHGYLLQIFTNCVQDRPTVFFEVIQRHNNNVSPPSSNSLPLRDVQTHR